MTSAIVGLSNGGPGWKTDRPYELLSEHVNRGWNWGDRPMPPSATDQLRAMFALDPIFRVLVTEGLNGIQVPNLQNKRMLDQIPDCGAPGRLQFKVYPGGHMYYSRDDSRKMLLADAKALMTGQ